MKSVDLVVIGAGPGGYVAAIKAAKLGMKVLVIEKEKLGGVCLNWGCIPTKAILKSAELYRKLQKASEYGLTASDVNFDLDQIFKRSRKISRKLTGGVGFLFKKNKVEHISGEAQFVSPRQVRVTTADEELIIEADRFIVATGAHPMDLPFARFDGKQIISYREALSPKTLPASMVIVGGGAIGLEFATFYASLGVEITLFEMLDRLAPGLDKDAAKLLERSLVKLGVTVHTGTALSDVGKNEKLLQCDYVQDGKKVTIEAEQLLLAAGFAGNVENIGLDRAGVRTEKRLIPVNEHGQTNVSHIYAIGDVTGAPGLAHTASAEGINAVLHMQNREDGYRLDNYPAAIYTSPEYAFVGLTEEQAEKQGLKIRKGVFPFTASGRALSSGETDGFVKTIFDQTTGELVGAHIVGENASELIHEYTVARTLETTDHELALTIHAHPTLSESLMESAEDAGGGAIHI